MKSIKKNKDYKKKIDAFKEYLININNVLSIIFLIFIQTQISKNNYNLKNKNILNSDNSWKTFNISDNDKCLNNKMIEYIRANLLHIISKNPDDNIFIDLDVLFNESKLYKLPVFHVHFINTIRYWLNPKYTLYNDLEKYFLFESGINFSYIKDYWTTYKPLYDNKLIKHINRYITDNNYLYKKYIDQNISLLKDINNDEPKYRELHITLSEIMNNPSFKRLYIYSLKGYGKSQVFPLLNLLTEQFINTIHPSNKKDIIKLLSNCHYNNSEKQYSSINYALLKNTFLKEIIDTELIKDKDNILKFVHINDFNQEYFLLNSNINKHYSYDPPNVYVNEDLKTLKENDSSILEKMFKYYCLDKYGNLIPNFNKEIDGVIINTNVLNSLLLDFNEDLRNDLTECKDEVPQSEEHFRNILSYLINKNKLHLDPNNYIEYTENYNHVDNYILNTDIEDRLISFFDYYKDLITDDIHDEFNNIKELIINRNHIIDNYKEEIEKPFYIIKKYQNQYIKNIDEYYHKLIKSERYLSFNKYQSINSINKDMRDELHEKYNIHFETNIPSILYNIISKLSSKNICDKMVDSIYYYVSVLKNTCNGEFNKSIREDSWKMSKYKNDMVKNYLSTNLLLRHNDIFFTHTIKNYILYDGNKEIYNGFNQYKSPIANNGTYIYFEGLYNYINIYRQNIHKLKTSKNNIINEDNILDVNKFIFIFIISKIVDYIDLLNDTDSDEYVKAKNLIDEYNGDDINIEDNIICLSRFLTDILNNIKQKLTDPNWIYMDNETYKKKLDEHNAREKQRNLDEMDNMSDDKRRLRSANQNIKPGSMYKESEKANLEYSESKEYKESIMRDRPDYELDENDGKEIGDTIVEISEEEVIDKEDKETDNLDEGYTDVMVAEGDEDEDFLD